MQKRAIIIFLCLLSCGLAAGCSPKTSKLLFSISNQDYEGAKCLIESGEDINEDIDNEGMKLVHFYAQNKRTSELHFCLRNGANPNEKDHSGRTALHYAVLVGSLKIVELLVEFGARISIKDNNGETALDMASKQSFGASLEIKKFLEARLEKEMNKT
jgi:ankyrin repeat protein